MRNAGWITAGLVGAGALAPAAAGQEEDRQWFGGQPWWTWDHVTGDWGGLRTEAEDAGLTLDVSYTWEDSSVFRGGLRRGASTRSLFDANLTLDLAPKFGIEGGSVYADFYSTDDGNPGGSQDAGDFQGISNIETADNLDQLGELWYQQELFDGHLRVKIGKIDAGEDFALAQSGADFLNYSAGYIQTIFPLPSFPDSAAGVVAFVYPIDGVYMGAGFFDGASGVDGVNTGANGLETFLSDEQSDDWFWIGETGYSWGGGGEGAPGRIAGGGWYHTGQFERFDGGVADGTGGFYALAEQRVWSPDPDDAESERGAWVFVEWGWANDEVSEAAGQYSAGLSVTGPLDWRPSDATGVFVSTVDLSANAGFAEDETAIEVFYKLQLTPFLSVTPDLQYIVHPSGDPAVNNALVGILRFVVDF